MKIYNKNYQFCAIVLYFFTNSTAFSSLILKFSMTKIYRHFNLSFFNVAASKTFANFVVYVCISYSNLLKGVLIYFTIMF